MTAALTAVYTTTFPACRPRWASDAGARRSIAYIDAAPSNPRAVARTAPPRGRARASATPSRAPRGGASRPRAGASERAAPSRRAARAPRRAARWPRPAAREQRLGEPRRYPRTLLSLRSTGVALRACLALSTGGGHRLGPGVTGAAASPCWPAPGRTDDRPDRQHHPDDAVCAATSSPARWCSPRSITSVPRRTPCSATIAEPDAQHAEGLHGGRGHDDHEHPEQPADVQAAGCPASVSSDVVASVIARDHPAPPRSRPAASTSVAAQGLPPRAHGYPFAEAADWTASRYDRRRMRA